VTQLCYGGGVGFNAIFEDLWGVNA
jgi:hypothetical protein